jgi:hypothetical protein
MENTFLADLQRQGRVDLDPSPNSEKENEEKHTPSSPEENQNEKEKSPSPQGEPKPEGDGGGTPNPDEGNENIEDDTKLPFHKHPRWVALQNELREAREFRESVSPLLERLGTKPEDRHEETIEIPDWFVELFGENETAWKKYRAYSLDERKQLRSEILREIQEDQKRVVDEQKKQEKWVDDELQKLSETGLKFDRNELLKIALEYLPTDDQGNISFKKAFDILQIKKSGKETEKPKLSEEKKKIADQTMAKGKSNEEKKDYKTSADFRGKSFHDLIPRD